jgi:hypothetical protein
MSIKLIMESWRKLLAEETAVSNLNLVPVPGAIDQDGFWYSTQDVEPPGASSVDQTPWFLGARSQGYPSKGPLQGKKVWEYFGRMPENELEFIMMNAIMSKDNVLGKKNPEQLVAQNKELASDPSKAVERMKGIKAQRAAKEEQKQATFIQQLAAYIKEKLPNVKFDPRNPGLAFGEIRQRANKRIEPPAGLFSGKCRIVDGDGMSRFVFDPEICYNANNLDVFKALIDAAAGTGPQIATPAAAGVTPGKAATAPGQKPPVTSKSPTGIKPV